MRVVMFCHSLISDWNHGNAHFLRGVVSELLARGHEVEVYEPRDAWSVQNLIDEHGLEAVTRFHAAYPGLRSHRFDLARLDLRRALRSADLVLVHEWNEPSLVKRIGDFRRRHPELLLLFHDTHHRAVTDEGGISRFDLSHYDGVLAFGGVIRDLYLRRGWAKHAWTWHEAADVRRFMPLERDRKHGELIWIGNWGDDERTRELQEFLIDPVRALGLAARVHGVRYPAEARRALAEAGIEFAGWLPNFEAPLAFSRFDVTVHVPRRPYAQVLPGIPTIRPFEALACGIPLISAPWDDREGLFTPGEDFLVAHSGAEMQRLLERVLDEPKLANSLRSHGLETIRRRHTCSHRVDELLAIVEELHAIQAHGRRRASAAPSEVATPES